MDLSGGESTHIPKLLQGGKTTGPIVKTKVGQVVRLAALYPGLAAQPRHDLLSTTSKANGNDNDNATATVFEHDNLSWVVELQQRLPTIQEEVRRVVPTLSESTWTSLRTRRGQDWSDSTGWAHIAMIDNFRFQEHNVQLFPETMRILQEVVGTERRMGPRLTAIARQKANSGIPKHVDFMNWMLTLHTALWGPKDGAGIVVNGIRKDWTVGDPVVMDTTYLHHTYNESEDEDLYILIVDFWHPDLSVDEIDALRSFFATNSGV
jgi:aspartyl/asparaginyl beta-hydroxylase (cupin superfamily)